MKVAYDRILAVAARSERFGSWRRRGDVDTRILDRIASFFEFYHAEQGKEFKPLGWKSAATARALIKDGRKRFAREHRGG